MEKCPCGKNHLILPKYHFRVIYNLIPEFMIKFAFFLISCLFFGSIRSIMNDKRNVERESVDL